MKNGTIELYDFPPHYSSIYFHTFCCRQGIVAIVTLFFPKEIPCWPHNFITIEKIETFGYMGSKQIFCYAVGNH